MTAPEQSDVRPVPGARVARYAEAMCRAEHPSLTPVAIQGGIDPRNRVAACFQCQRHAHAVVAVADAEQAELRDRVAFLEQEEEHQREGRAEWFARAEAAEAKLRDVEAERDALRADVESLAEHLAETQRGGVSLLSSKRVEASLRAVLARSQAPQAPAEQEGRR